MRKLLFVVLVAPVLLSGCSTMVAIRTDPDGAKIRLDGEPLGKSPLNIQLSNFDFEAYVIDISKEGYKPLTAELRKELKVGAFVFGLLLWWPELLWVYGPKPVQTFELEPVA